MSKLSLLKTTIGIIGNQNADVARLIYEAHRLGIKIGVYTSKDSYFVRDADFKVIGQLNDKDRIKRFAMECQLVMYVDGSGISTGLINYLRQVTDVPQGSDALDLINDRAILRVLLDSLHIKSLPYKTIFSLSDVKQALATDHRPLYLQPVQSSYNEQPSVVITDSNQLDRLRDVFNGETYLLEALPEGARYFKLTFVKSKTGVASLPVIEEHYRGQYLSTANLNATLSPEVSDQFAQIVENLTNHLNYVGGLTISLIVTPDHHVYVDNVELPFNLVNNVYNLTHDNLYQTVLRAELGLSVQLKHLDKTWLLEVINQHNVDRVQDLWISNDLSHVDLSSSLNDDNQMGYALMSADTLDNIKKQVQKDQL